MRVLFFVLWLLLFPFLAESRTIWVNPTSGNDSNTGLSQANANLTIQGGINDAQAGDLILVVGNASNPVRIYESPTISSKNNLWVLAFPRGGVVVSAMDETADQGTRTWTSDGDNRWRINMSNPPWIMGYTDPGGTDWFLPEYTCNDLDDHVANFCSNSSVVTEYGYCHDSGVLKIRLPSNANPNGKRVRIGFPGRFQGDVFTVNNSSSVIIDGFILEGAENCIDADTNSPDLIARNIDMQYCRNGILISDDSKIEWTRYTYPGYKELNDVLHAIDASNGNDTAWDLVKDYAIEGGGDCTISTIEGSMVDGLTNTTGLEIAYSITDGTMDGIRLFEIDGADIHHSIFSSAVDNLIEFESDTGPGCFDNTIHHSYFETRGFDPWSGQSGGTLCQGTIHHSVLRFLDDSPQSDTTHGLWKYNVTNSSTRYFTYNNLIFLNEKEFWTSNPTIPDVHVLRNNIYVSTTGNLEGSYSGTSTHNILVSPVNRSWITSNNGFFSTNTSGINFIDQANRNYGITSGSTAQGNAVSISGITTSSDIGPFAVGENPGVVATAQGGTWPRPFAVTFDESIPTGWTGDLPPNIGGLYVSPTGSGSACSNASPCSLSTGQSAVPSGGTLILKNGTYGWFDTTKTNVTYQAENEQLAIIASEDSHTGGVYAIGVRHSGTVIDGLRVTGQADGDSNVGGGSGHGVIRVFQVNGLTIRNALVENSAGELINFCGTITSNCSNLLIEDSTWLNAGLQTGGNAQGEALYICEFSGANTCTNITIRRNLIKNFVTQGLDVKPGGVNVQVFHNIFEGQKKPAGAAYDPDGVFVDQSGELNFFENIVRNNAATTTSGTSVFRATINGDIIRDNVVYGNTYTGSFLIRDRSGGSGAPTEIFENVFCSNSGTAIDSVFTNVHDNTFATGTPSPGCTAKENEILALIGGGDPPVGSGDINAGLIAYWPMEASLLDALGSKTLTYNGPGLGYVTGQIGCCALNFDGASWATPGVHAIGGTSLFPEAGKSFSVSSWFKTAATGTVIASAQANSGNRDFQIAVSASRLDLYMRGLITSAVPDYGDDAWHHVVVTWDGTTAKWYVDGVLEPGTVLVGSEPEDTSEVITIGARTTGTGFPIIGAIDDVRIYNIAIDQGVVTSLFTLTDDTSPPSPPTNLSIDSILSTSMGISWTASTDDQGPIQYLVEICDGAACSDFVQVATVSNNMATLTGLTPSTLYRVRVRARDSAFNLSAYTSIVEGTTISGADTEAPDIPANLAAVATSSTEIDLTWDAASDNGGGSVVAYPLLTCTGSACTPFFEFAAPATLAHTASELDPSTIYGFCVKARDDSSNTSACSATEYATTPGGVPRASIAGGTTMGGTSQ